MFLFINHSHYKLILYRISNGLVGIPISMFQSKMFLNCCYYLVFSLLPLISAYLIFPAFSVSVGDTIIYPVAFIWKLRHPLPNSHLTSYLISYQFSWYLTISQMLFYFCSVSKLYHFAFCLSLADKISNKTTSIAY